jgi:hypothetical protein
MADEVRVWRVAEDDSLKEINSSLLDREERIEKWITQDIGVLAPHKPGLLVIGEQVRTDFGKEIDLLCIDSTGDLVIVELKRERTPREVASQALDYASWVKDLGIDKIEEIAAGFLKGDKSLKEAFEETFEDTDFPEVINDDHSIMIVASEVDDSTERIIRYLSDRGVNINFVRFQMFRTHDNLELLVRTFTVPPDEADQNTRRSGKTKRTASHYKTLEVRLSECTNSAQVAFLTERLRDPKQETDRRRIALAYTFAGRIRFKVWARRSHAHVIQRGRFSEDFQFWKERLSIPDVGFRDKGARLRFALKTKADFETFQKVMENEARSFHWLLTDQGTDEVPDEEDAE